MDASSKAKFLLAARVAAGVAIAAVWATVAFFWAALSFMGTLMANDSGRASEAGHMALILGALAGQLLAGFAGMPLGAAVFWGARRRLLLRIFAALFLAGVAAQVGAAWVFFRAAQP